MNGDDWNRIYAELRDEIKELYVENEYLKRRLDSLVKLKTVDALDYEERLYRRNIAIKMSSYAIEALNAPVSETDYS